MGKADLGWDGEKSHVVFKASPGTTFAQSSLPVPEQNGWYHEPKTG
jgi:hypothetical protein